MSRATDQERRESHDHMQAGLALLDIGKATEALAHFDEAVALRERWPWQEDAESAWMLAAAWINRADALRAAGVPHWREASLQSLDRGIEVIRVLPFAEQPVLSDRLVLAVIKKADVLADSERNEEAVAAYDEARSLLDRFGRGEAPEGLRLTAMMAGNRARLEAALGQHIAAVESARESVQACRTLEAVGLRESAGVKARFALAMALAATLDGPGADSISPDWIAETTDAIEEALLLAEDLGIRHSFTRDLVRSGAKIYRVCQPHFLGEFVISRTPSQDAELRREMLHELWLARLEAERRVLAAPHDDEVVAQQSRILESLKKPLEVMDRA